MYICFVKHYRREGADDFRNSKYRPKILGSLYYIAASAANMKNKNTHPYIRSIIKMVDGGKNNKSQSPRFTTNSRKCVYTRERRGFFLRRKIFTIHNKNRLRTKRYVILVKSFYYFCYLLTYTCFSFTPFFFRPAFFPYFEDDRKSKL